MIKSLAVSALAFASLVLAPSAFSQTDEEAVRETVLHYFEGGNTGSPDRVAQAFDTENGHFYVRRSTDGEDTISAWPLGEFASVFSNAPPYERAGEFAEIRIVDDSMAFVHFIITMPGREFDDFFLLYKVEGDWRIVSKTASLELLEE